MIRILNEKSYENGITIYTGLNDEYAKDIINGVVGQLSDGIWENSPGMDKYWRHMTVDTKGNEITVSFDTNSYNSGFRGKTEEQLRKWLANKIKQIVKEEGLDWNRDNEEVCDYLNYYSDCTVQDAYRVYDKILGRKERIAARPDFRSSQGLNKEAIRNIEWALKDIKRFDPGQESCHRVIAILSKLGSDFDLSEEQSDTISDILNRYQKWLNNTSRMLSSIYNDLTEFIQ